MKKLLLALLLVSAFSVNAEPEVTVTELGSPKQWFSYATWTPEDNPKITCYLIAPMGMQVGGSGCYPKGD